MRIISYLHNKPSQLSISAGYILQIFYKYEVLGLAMSNDNDYLDASCT